MSNGGNTIAAIVRNAGSRHEALVATDGNERSLPVPAKPTGSGSAVNGGEFLMLALATCYCTTLPRGGEARDRAQRRRGSSERPLCRRRPRRDRCALQRQGFVDRAGSGDRRAAAPHRRGRRSENTVRSGVPVVLEQP